MMMPDDTPLDVLERDLRALAESTIDDEKVRLGVRRQLVAATRPRRRPRPIRVALGTAALTAAAALATAVFVTAGSGSGGPDIAEAAVIHHALRAVSWPANAILHEQVVGEDNGIQVEGSWWQQTSPPYASRGIKGETGHMGEFGDNGTTSFEYDPASNTITQHPDTAPPSFSDPASGVRQELANGHAHVAGTVAIDGGSLFKISLGKGLLGYFDTRDYRLRYLDDPQRNGSVVRLRVITYQYLPMTSANRALLSVTGQHPTARIVAVANGTAGK